LFLYNNIKDKKIGNNKMPIYQTFNGKIKAWVKYRKFANGKTLIQDVKQREPMKPFKGITKR